MDGGGIVKRPSLVWGSRVILAFLVCSPFRGWFYSELLLQEILFLSKIFNMVTHHSHVCPLTGQSCNKKQAVNHKKEYYITVTNETAPCFH